MAPEPPPSPSPTGAARIVSVGTRTPLPPPATAAHLSSPQETTLPLAEQSSARLLRCLRIIGAFSDAFVGLKKGYEQFGAEVGVRPLTGTTKLHRARTSQEIVEYLLDPATDPKLADEHVIELYRAMVRTRVIDERLVVLQRQGRIGFHIGFQIESPSFI